MDTISQDGFSKTKINKPVARKPEELTEEEKEKKLKNFVKENEKDLKVNQTKSLESFDLEIGCPKSGI